MTVIYIILLTCTYYIHIRTYVCCLFGKTQCFMWNLGEIKISRQNFQVALSLYNWLFQAYEATRT